MIDFWIIYLLIFQTQQPHLFPKKEIRGYAKSLMLHKYNLETFLHFQKYKNGNIFVTLKIFIPVIMEVIIHSNTQFKIRNINKNFKSLILNCLLMYVNRRNIMDFMQIISIKKEKYLIFL